MRSQRQLRVGEEIKHALAMALSRGDVVWPEGFRPKSIITVTEVQVSPDLKNATAFVMPLGGLQLAESVQALNQIVGQFRHYLAEHVQLRYVPQLTFKPDTTFDNAAHIESILNKINH